MQGIFAVPRKSRALDVLIDDPKAEPLFVIKKQTVITVLVGLKSPIVIRGSTMAFALLEGIEELLIFRGEDCSGVCFLNLV